MPRAKPKSKLTARGKRTHVARGGTECPFCKSESIEGGSVEIYQGLAVQYVSCSNCGAEWRDDYFLRAVAQIEKPECYRGVANETATAHS